jgi:serine O-acetyltransferase
MSRSGLGDQRKPVGSFLSSGPTGVGNRVQIGAGAKILGRVNVGDDVIIGANAVVVHDVPPNAAVGGVPARLLGAA